MVPWTWIGRLHSHVVFFLVKKVELAKRRGVQSSLLKQFTAGIVKRLFQLLLDNVLHSAPTTLPTHNGAKGAGKVWSKQAISLRKEVET